jgi:hypothetical protein
MNNNKVAKKNIMKVVEGEFIERLKDICELLQMEDKDMMNILDANRLLASGAKHTKEEGKKYTGYNVFYAETMSDIKGDVEIDPKDRTTVIGAMWKDLGLKGQAEWNAKASTWQPKPKEGKEKEKKERTKQKSLKQLKEDFGLVKVEVKEVKGRGRSNSNSSRIKSRSVSRTRTKK